MWLGRPLLRQHRAKRIAWPAFGDFAHLFDDVIDDTAAYRQPGIGRMDRRGLFVGDNVSKKPEVNSDAGTYQHGQWATTLGDAVGGVHSDCFPDLVYLVGPQPLCRKEFCSSVGAVDFEANRFSRTATQANIVQDGPGKKQRLINLANEVQMIA